jgi:hypothetical protein
MKKLKNYKNFLNESKSKGKEIVYTFKNKSYSLSDDKTKKHDYNVHILKNFEDDEKYDFGYDNLILSIESTPGSWYVSTLLENYDKDSEKDTSPDFDYFVIDGGQKWYGYNKHAIMKELIEVVSDLPKLWSDYKKNKIKSKFNI